MFCPRTLVINSRPTMNRGANLVRSRCRATCRLGPSTIMRRYFSSDQAAEDTRKTTKFPWRHSTSLIPRVELDQLRLKKGGWRYRFALGLWQCSTAIAMGKQVSEVVGSNEWRKELAEDSGWAWTLAMAALLSNTFRVPVDDLLSREAGDLKINFSYTTPYTKSEATQSSDEQPEVKAGNEANGTDAFGVVDGVLEKDYVRVFQNFHRKSHEHQSLLQLNPMEITLNTKPIDAELHLIHCFPFLSRDAVNADPSKRKEWDEVLSGAADGPAVFYQKLKAFGDKEVVERGKIQTTIMADVLVMCLESFRVKDLTTEEVVQGDGVERTVSHAVRLEMDVILDVTKEESVYIVSDWRIANVDDMVGSSDFWNPFPG